MKSLQGKVAVVTGASRGAGKGIATVLGKAGATVYVTGRTATPEQRPELAGQPIPGTIVETVAEINRLGGTGIAVNCDHRNDDEVAALFKRVEEEQGGLDILVNNAFMGGPETLSGKGFWEAAIDNWDVQHKVGLRSAYVASVFAARLMVRKQSGLIVNISSPCAGGYMLAVAYGVIKAALDRLSHDMAVELRPHNVASVSLWPGAIATEKVALFSAMGGMKVPSQGTDQETPTFVGRAVAALAGDPNIMVKSGLTFITSELGMEYGYTDVNGNQPRSLRDVLWGPPAPPAIRKG